MRYCFLNLTFLFIVAYGCQTTGIVGTGEVQADQVERLAAGLTSAEYEILSAGPRGPLTASAVDALIDRESEIHILLQPHALSERGLIDVLFTRAPPEYRQRLDSIQSQVGADIIAGVEALSLWGAGIRSGDGFIGLAAYSRSLSVLQLYDALVALSTSANEEMQGDDTSAGNMDLELTLLAAVPKSDLEALYTRLQKEAELVQRIEFDDRNHLALFRDTSKRYYYAHIWPTGMRLAMLSNEPVKPMEVAARRALDSVSSLNNRTAVIGTLPTVRVRFEYGSEDVYLEARCETVTELILEVPVSMLGSDENLLRLLENWEQMRSVLIRLISTGSQFAQAPRLRDLLIAAIEAGRVSESVDGLRLETEVDTSLLVDGLTELPAQ